MRLLRISLSPGRLATATTVLAVVVIEWSLSGVVTGLLGALTGGLAGVAASQLGLLVSVPLAGLAVRRLVVGAGPRVADWSTPHRTIALRAVPIILSVSVRVTRPPVRRRLWLSALCVLTFEVTLAVVALLVMAGPFTRGFAVAAVASLVLSLVPKHTATTMSTGWLLFRLPPAAQLEAAPAIGRTMAAARAGDLATAERLAAHLLGTYPNLRPALAARVSVLEAQGRYAEALVLAVKLASDAHAWEAATAFAALAGLSCATVETGELDTETGLATASKAIEHATALGYPTHRLNGIRAMIALLRGNAAEAITLARQSADTTDDLLTRADDLATLARAHMATGDNRAAREVLTEAEKLAKWRPRVAHTRTRLEVAG